MTNDEFQSWSLACRFVLTSVAFYAGGETILDDSVESKRLRRQIARLAGEAPKVVREFNPRIIRAMRPHGVSEFVVYPDREEVERRTLTGVTAHEVAATVLGSLNATLTDAKVYCEIYNDPMFPDGLRARFTMETIAFNRLHVAMKLEAIAIGCEVEPTATSEQPETPTASARQPEAPTPTPEQPQIPATIVEQPKIPAGDFLGLIVDELNHTVERSGKKKQTLSPIEWSIFLPAWKARENGVNADRLKDQYAGDRNGRGLDNTKKRLRTKLQRLGVTLKKGSGAKLIKWDKV